MTHTDSLPRFDFHATSVDQALFYYNNRMTQLLSGPLAHDWAWFGNYQDLGWGIEIPLNYKFGTNQSEIYSSLYVFEKGQGHYANWLNEKSRNVAVGQECTRVLDYLNKRGINYKLASVDKSDAYLAIEKYYGDRRAARTKQFLMNHIDEGSFILRRAVSDLGYNDFDFGFISASLDGFFLHPLVQNDGDLCNNMSFVRKNQNYPSTQLGRALNCAMEYRNIANQYLPKHGSRKFEDIVLSPIEEVNLMLIADKIQSRKDFEKYHLGSHPNSDGLVEYFDNWFRRLQIPESFYLEMVSLINIRTGQN